MSPQNSADGGGTSSYVLISPAGHVPWQLMSGQGDLQPSPDLPDAEQQRLTIGPQLSLDGEQLGSGSRAPSGLQGPLSHVDSAVAHRPDLPSNKVCDESFDDAYVAFILHCNPAVPPDTNTTELRKAFRSPPKSDGKSFSTFTLFELIRKLESKEIKTWGDLAMRLGVEPPAMDKGQSAQKVQQYAVRLKRWMHAMHVDAFFEYLLGNSHIYWTEIPPAGASELGRHDVPPEEDLALRALLPETRPKRGRKRAEDKDDYVKSPAQKPRTHSPVLAEDLHTAQPASFETHHTSAPRLAWPTSDPQMVFALPETPLAVHNQWHGMDMNQTPITPYPQSAITPRMSNPFLPYEGEPQSAVTPSSKSRRRHGPAVSSAWPSSSNTSAGKLRGRPPSNRSITDGPFSTFPVNPTTKPGTITNLRNSTVPSTPVVDDSEVRTSVFTFPPPSANNRAPATRPSKLFLQVPERVGGPVRLATPPPAGPLDTIPESSLSEQTSNDHVIKDFSMTSNAYDPFGRSASPQKNVLNMQTKSTQNPVSSANGLDFQRATTGDCTNVAEIEMMFTRRILCAQWLNHRGLPTQRCSLGEAHQIARQVIQYLRTGAPSKETFLLNVASFAGADHLRASRDFMKMTRLEKKRSEMPFEAKWTLRFGDVEASYNLKISIPHRESTTENGSHNSTSHDQEDWQQKFMALQASMEDRDTKARKMRDSIVEAILALDGSAG